MKNITLTEYYIVRDRTSGGAYLTNRRSRSNSNEPKYRWAKDYRNQAVRLCSYDAAQKARQRYGGEIVRCLKVVAPDFKATSQVIVSAE